MMMPHAPSIVAPLPILRQNWKTLARLAFRQSRLLDATRVPRHLCPPIGFEGQPINHNLHGFEDQTKKPSWWFCGPNHQTVAIGFEAQIGKPSHRFWGQSTDKLSTLVLRPNQETCTPRLLMHGADHRQHHPTSRLSGHYVPDLCDHSRSSAPSLLLLPRSSSLPTMLHLSPAHYETSKRDSPHETKVHVRLLKCHRFEFKPWHVNDSSHIKPRYWAPSFSISPWWVHWQQKAQSLKFESKTPWSTTRRPKSQRKAQEGHLEEGKTTKPTKDTKSGKPNKMAKKS
jgi:hypothetical protein